MDIHDWNRILKRVAPIAVSSLAPLSFAFTRAWQVAEAPKWMRRRRQMRRVTDEPPAATRSEDGTLTECLAQLPLAEFPSSRLSGMNATSLMGLFEMAPMYLNSGRRTRNLAYPYPSAFHPTVIPGDRGIPLSGRLGLHHAKSQRPALIVLHGYLHSSSNDVVRSIMLKAWHDWGFHVLAYDMRGFGRTSQFSSTPASGGLIEARDLLAVARYLKRFKQVTTVGVVGISLGGATSLLAGSLDHGLHEKLLDGGVMAICPPWDLHRVLKRFDSPTEDPEWIFTQHVFRALFSRSVRNSDLNRWMKKRLRPGVSISDLEGSLLEFMEHVVAAGYLSRKKEYRERPPDKLMRKLMNLNSPMLRLDRIHFPTLVLSALDDPIVEMDATLVERLKRRAAGNPHVHLEFTPGGGHCAYPAVANRWYYEVMQRFFSYWAGWRTGKINPFAS